MIVFSLYSKYQYEKNIQSIISDVNYSHAYFVSRTKGNITVSNGENKYTSFIDSTFKPLSNSSKIDSSGTTAAYAKNNFGQFYYSIPFGRIFLQPIIGDQIGFRYYIVLTDDKVEVCNRVMRSFINSDIVNTKQSTINGNTLFADIKLGNRNDQNLNIQKYCSQSISNGSVIIDLILNAY